MASPLAIGTALKLAALIAAVSLAAELLRGAYGEVGVYVVAALSGVADVDAITIAMARMGGDAAAPDWEQTAVRAILLAVAVNTVAKAVMAGWSGGIAIGLRVVAASLAALLAAIVTMIWAAP
jgi:uncharacterized membrane protein (DUF4010 family)